MKPDHRPKGRAPSAPVSACLTGPMDEVVARAVRRLARLPGLARVAVMPDVHLAEKVCVGVVLATRGRIYPEAVGGDIGCGISTVALAGDAASINPDRARALLAAWGAGVPVIRHRSLAAAPGLPADLDPGRLASSEAAAAAQRDGRIELGTLGRGNHFLELQRDDDNRLWLMVHSGSRAMGQVVARSYLRQATPAGGGLSGLEADSPAGRGYLNDSAWAVRYAALNRRIMLGAAAAAVERELGMGAEWGSFVDTSHNHLCVEEHFGERVLVHRKGAGRAGEGEPGLIPGSMGTHSYHVTGRGDPGSLRSSSHGAGRVVPRGAARQLITFRDLRTQLDGVIFDERIAGALREEAPGAYRDIDAVMRAQRGLVRIVRRVRTLMSFKGG